MADILNGEWSLDVLYKGYEDPSLKKDFASLEQLNHKFEELAQTLEQKGVEDVLSILELEEVYQTTWLKIYCYMVLRQSVNTSDAQAKASITQVSQIEANKTKSNTKINKWIASLPDLEKQIEKEKKLSAYAFYLQEKKEEVSHMLSDEVEEMISFMNLSAGSAWSSLFDYLTSTVVVDYKGEETNLSTIRNLAYDDDKTVRKEAYEAELASYKKIEAPIAYALNNIKAQVNMLSKKRGFSSPLEMTLTESRMKKETLDALWTACKEYLPKFHAYLKRKAEILGYTNGLPWYELFAPLGKSKQKFTEESAKNYLVKHFSGFADDLADMVKEAFENKWIDFYPHPGKVGGAFCENLPFVKQSRILTNFDGIFGDVVTLAHELGHAYHGLQIQDHLPLNTVYTMPVAETASTFNENIIMNAAIKEATGKEKLILIENQLQDFTQVICDIYSRFLFEQEVFERNQTSFLFPEDLKEIMLWAQEQAYGEGLDKNFMHPYMWACKGHYYSENISYYNFPYAFGALFAKGLYAQYQKEKEAFVPKYRALLKATTVASVEDVAKMAGIDLTNPEFWRQSLKLGAESIDEFIRLSKEEQE